MRISSEISWCFLFPLVLYSTEANCIWQFPDYAITGDPVFHPVFLMSSTFWATTRCHRSMAGHVGKVLLCDLESQTDCLAFWAVIWHCSTPFAGISAYLPRSFCYIYIYTYMSHISLSCHVFFGIFGESNGKGQARAVCLPTPGDDLQMRPSPSRGLSGASSIFVDAGQSRPDGSILDAEGGLWNAEFGAGSAWSYPRENVAWMTKFLLHIGMDDGWLHTNYILKESRHIIICICKYDYAHACNIFVGPAQTDRETVHSEALKMSLTLFVCIYMYIYIYI